MLLKKSLITASLLAAMSVPAIAEDVKIGVPSWTGAQAMAHLLGAVVEMRIGGTVDYVPGNNATIFQGMDQGIRLGRNDYRRNRRKGCGRKLHLR